MRRLVALASSIFFLLAGCGDPDEGGGPRERELTVSAAASLTDAFGDIGRAFEDENPGVTVTFNFGPSDGLAGQINEGAPVDVFASASTAWMDSVESNGPGVAGRIDFTRNELAIIVPTDNPAGIETLDDLTNTGVKLVLAAEGVPAGDYAREVFDNAGISDAARENVVSNEEDVRAVITKVLSGDADAGITYVTDVTTDIDEQVEVVAIDDEDNVTATYPIAVVSTSEEADLAQAFVDFVLGEGQQTLSGYGFLSV